MDDDTLRKFAESLASHQAADDQSLTEIERVFELVKLALMKMRTGTRTTYVTATPASRSGVVFR